jgi:CheY-like chemotaxis protein
LPDAPRILLLDGDRADRALARAVLQDSNIAIRIHEVAGALDFADVLGHRSWTVAIAERDLEWADGIEVLSALKRRHPRCVTVLFTRSAPDELGTVGRLGGVDAYVRKESAGYLRLPTLIEQAAAQVAQQHTDTEGRQLRGEIDTLPLGYFWALSDGTLLYGNGATHQLLESPPASRSDTISIFDYFADANERTQCEKLWTLGARQSSLRIQIRRSHDTHMCHLSFWPVTDPQGRPCLEGFISPLPAEPALHTVESTSGPGADQVPQAPTTTASDGGGARPQLVPPIAVLHSWVSQANATRAPAAAEPPAKTHSRHPSASTAAVEAVDLGALVREAVQRLQPQAKAAGARFRGGHLPILQLQRPHISRLLRELFDNAWKACADAPPYIEVRAERQVRGWLLSVRDNGCGMSESELEALLCGPLLDASSEHGLAICRRVALLYGGELWISSRTGKGTTVFIALDVRAAPQRPITIVVDGKPVGEINIPTPRDKRRIARAALKLPCVRERIGNRTLRDVRLEGQDTVHLVAG